MKQFVFLWILLLSMCFVSAQEVQFPPSILNAGGVGVDINNNQISRWRLGYVNVIQLKTGSLKSGSTEMNGLTSDSFEDWKITSYPNPTKDFVNIQFEMNEQTVFRIRLTDITGQRLIEKKMQSINPGEVIELDLRQFTPAIYFIHIWSYDNTIKSVSKISKN